jgi:thiol-disulfide isomerase/thioredoxin
VKTIDYWTAVWCTPCKALKPKVQALCAKNGWTLIEHDFDDPANHLLAVTLGIQSVPTLYMRHNDRLRILTETTATSLNVKKEMSE